MCCWRWTMLELAGRIAIRKRRTGGNPNRGETNMAFNGVYRGVVTDSGDPTGAGRVKVRVTGFGA